MTQENRTTLSNWLVIVGLLVMVVMALMPLFNYNQEWMRWAFGIGAMTVLVGRVIGMNRGSSLRIRRLHRLLVSSGFLYCASAIMLFMSPNSNDWMAFLFAGVVMQVYASWMIDHEEKKTGKEQ